MISACACLGVMYDEPYCYCEMVDRGLDVENNPLRIEANKDSESKWNAFAEMFGWATKAE